MLRLVVSTLGKFYDLQLPAVSIDVVGNVCVVAVVVYNVVVISGEDIGGQMGEMAIFGVPLVRSHGVPGCPRV